MTAADLTTILALLEAVAAAERGPANAPGLLGVAVVTAAAEVDASLILRVEEQIRRARLQARVFGTVTL